MKYILMCGGKYDQWTTPKQLLKVNGEVILERTIRLLKENKINDISISTDNPAFEYLGLPILKHNNSYKCEDGKIKGHWVDAFYPTDEPTCYIFGDVYFSEEAIKKIINTKTEDIELFGSAPPFADMYPKRWVEPFALKVVDTDHLKEAVQKTKELDAQNKFWRKPIMWELWTVIKNVPLQTKPNEYIYNYTPINDYTSDVDNKGDVASIEYYLKVGGGNKMVKVKCTVEYNDMQLNKLVKVGEELVVTKERANYLANERGLVEIVEVIPEKVVPKKQSRKK